MRNEASRVRMNVFDATSWSSCAEFLTEEKRRE